MRGHPLVERFRGFGSGGGDAYYRV
jgi:hypothetical protein